MRGKENQGAVNEIMSVAEIEQRLDQELVLGESGDEWMRGRA